MTSMNRRELFRAGGAVALGATVSSLLSSNLAYAAEKSKSGKAKFNLGLASYSTRQFDRKTTIEYAKRAGLKYMCFKDMHLKLDSSDEQCAQAAQECRDAGITLYGGGVIYMNKPEEVENAFRYAKASGMDTIVGVPGEKVLDLVNQKVKETGIYVAIHNHGPGDKLYATPEMTYEKVKNLDPRIGLCVDIGHTVRIGADLNESIRKYQDRIFDFHFKDETEASAAGKACICGRGVIDFPTCLEAIIATGYDRIISFEYETDAKDPLPGLMESVGFVRGVLAML